MGSLDYDYIFKVVIIGDKDVGKTSLLTRLCEDRFITQSQTTIGVDFLIKDIRVGPHSVKLELWDTAGEEKYKAVTSVYYRRADAVVVVFDVSRKETFNSVKHWYEDIIDQCGSEVYVVLVGNKCDLDFQVSEDDIQDFAELHLLYWVETSAKSSTNIEDTFQRVAEDLIERRTQLMSLQSMDSGPGSLFLRENSPPAYQGYCCSYL